MPLHTYISWDIILPVYMYLLYLLNGTAAVWMKSSVFIHLTQLPSNPILFGFGRLGLRCDFSETKIHSPFSDLLCYTRVSDPDNSPPYTIQQILAEKQEFLG